MKRDRSRRHYVSIVGCCGLLALSPLHGASQIGVSPSGHYITYQGQPLLLIGDSGTQCVMQNANLDYRRWIDDCADRSLRALHIWSFVAPRQTADGSVIEDRYGYRYPGITPWARTTSGPNATDGFKQWDLRTFDEGPDDTHYWPRLRALCSYARDKDMLVGITVFFGWPKWNTDARPDWSYHPLNTVNGGPVQDSGTNVTKAQIIADPGHEVLAETWSDTWSVAKKTQWIWERFAAKLIEDTAAFGNVFFVFMDEHSYSEGNCGDHFAAFFRSRDAVWVDWNARRQLVDFVCSGTVSGADKNAVALSGFAATPERPYLFLEGPPYVGAEVRTSIWTFAIGGGHFFFHNDAGQETVRTGIMGYDPNVPGGSTGMIRRDWLGHASSFFNNQISGLDTLAPHNELTGPGAYCLADPGREYALYSLMGTPTALELDLTAAPGTFRWRLYDPQTGTFAATFFTSGGSSAFFVKPDENDWVLHLLRDDEAGAPVASFTADPAGGPPPLAVDFDATASADPGGSIESYAWSFGDGEDGTGPTVRHTYDRQGSFVAVLTVTDNEGNAATAAMRIEVGASTGALVTRITGIEPGGTGLTGSVVLTAVTLEGDLTLRDLLGATAVRTAGSFDVGRTQGLPGVSIAATLEGLELGYALLGLSAAGERVEAYFPETIVPDGSPAPELVVLEWSASTDSFQIVLLANGPDEPHDPIATVQVEGGDYGPTNTSLNTTSVGTQPVGGVAVDLDQLNVPDLRLRGVRLPAEDGSGGITGLDPAVVAAVPSREPRFIRGDANADGATDISDAIVILIHLFTGQTTPPCFDAADSNDDGNIDLADAIALLGRLFGGADALPAPFTACGTDPTGDTLQCATFAPCSGK